MTTQVQKDNSVATVNPTVDFGLALLRQEAAASKGKNVLISPASVAIALAMTLNGARQATLSAMKSTLGFCESDTLEAINASLSAILAALTNPNSGVELSIANAIWAEKSMEFNPEFLSDVVNAYRATVTNADFADPSTVAAINEWADKNTNGKISTIIESISPDMVMYLLNAIYFKGQWTTQFSRDLSFDNIFTSETGARSSVPFMMREDEVRYTLAQSFAAAVLPFGEAEQVALYAILPNADVDINSFVESLDASTLALVKAGTKSELVLQMPRFSLEYDVDLKESLALLGMEVAFSRAADFGGMADSHLEISTVKHKTFARFDEEGGEAAAVTAVGMMLESLRITPCLVLNRPFVIALVDEQTDTLLFAGKVAEIAG